MKAFLSLPERELAPPCFDRLSMRGAPRASTRFNAHMVSPISRPTLMVAFDKLTMREVDCHVAVPPDIPHGAQRQPDTLILSLSKGEGCRAWRFPASFCGAS